MTLRLRLTDTIGPGEQGAEFDDHSFDHIVDERKLEADQFYDCGDSGGSFGGRAQRDAPIVRRAAVVEAVLSLRRGGLAGWRSRRAHLRRPDRKSGRNHEWTHLYNADVISMPDKWEYPWYAAWDLAFHCVPLALVDSEFAKEQLALMLREWYMHPNGQLPAYEWAFGDVNPPVHAWAAWRVYKIEKKRRGVGDRAFLERVFHKLLLNFTWWVNRKDAEGRNIFQGGFLGLDNIGVFDRSKPLPTGGFIEQADGTGWMAMYSLNLLAIAHGAGAAKTRATKTWPASSGSTSCTSRTRSTIWAATDGMWRRRGRLLLRRAAHAVGRARAAEDPLDGGPDSAVRGGNAGAGGRRQAAGIQAAHGVVHRATVRTWRGHVACMNVPGEGQRRLLSIVNGDQLRRVLRLLLDENEFLSPYGIRALSRVHKDHPFVMPVDHTEYRVDYEPAESATGLFGGNSNWRGPVWFPVNYLIIESLQKFHHYFG